MLVFDKVIEPSMAFAESHILPKNIDLLDLDKKQENIETLQSLVLQNSKFLMKVLYHLFWVAPVFVLCYASQKGFYQELADSMHRHHSKMKRGTKLTKTVGDNLYSTLVWILTLVWCKVLSDVLPFVLKHAQQKWVNISIPIIVQLALWLVGQAGGGAVAEDIVTYLPNFLEKIVVESFDWISYIGNGISIIITCSVFSWYAFDLRWISYGVGAEQRFRQIETKWEYFLGFGTPYVLLAMHTSGRNFYTLYLALFPFCLIMAGNSDYSSPYMRFRANNASQGTVANRLCSSLGVFRFGHYFAMLAISMIDSQYKAPRCVRPPRLSKLVNDDIYSAFSSRNASPMGSPMGSPMSSRMGSPISSPGSTPTGSRTGSPRPPRPPRSRLNSLDSPLGSPKNAGSPNKPAKPSRLMAKK